MSNCTHFVGVFRIDLGDPDIVIGSFKSNEWLLGDYSEKGPRYDVIYNEPGHFPMYTIAVSGDLRDHEDTRDVVQWFGSVILSMQWCIRDAVITTYNEHTKKQEVWDLLNTSVDPNAGYMEMMAQMQTRNARVVSTD